MPQLNCQVSQALLETLERHARQQGESVSHVVSAALSKAFAIPYHTLFQVSTSGALVQGVYERAVSSQQLLEYGDFGIGTFENLDGEMVVLDGCIYQIKGNGVVSQIVDPVGTPFALITAFTADRTETIFSAGHFADIQQLCDKFRDSNNLFYAIRIDGHFDHVHTRAVNATKSHLPLAQAAAIQPEFSFDSIDGTLVGIWSPQFSSTFNIAGYHFHFISDDRSKGGHLLDCSGKNLRVQLERLNDFHLSLPESEEFLRADLSRDFSKDLAYAEQAHEKEAK